jgi:hypothetical protein
MGIFTKRGPPEGHSSRAARTLTKPDEAAGDELHARGALLTVFRLVLVMHCFFGRLPLIERRTRPRRRSQAGGDGDFLEHDPAGSLRRALAEATGLELPGTKSHMSEREF